MAAVGSMTRNRRVGDRAGFEHNRDGVRWVTPLAIGMFVYRRTLNHDSLGVFLAAFAGPLLLLALTASTVAA